MTQTLVPIVLFVCIAYTIKVVVEALSRRRLLQTELSTELLESLVRSEETQRRHTALRWGIVFTLLAVAFIIMQVAGWNQINAGVIGLLAAALGIGHLVFYAIVRRLEH